VTVSQFQAAAQITSDTEFRAFGSAYRSAVAAAGFIQTADTGQINWATVTKPTGTNTSGGYEIWRFNDAAQATHPLFFKLEYGTAVTASRLSIWVTIGAASDGAGAITGTRVARTQFAQSANSATLGDVWVAGSDGYFTTGVFAGPATAGNSIPLVIERLRSSDGTVDTTTTAGVVLAGGQAGTVIWVAALYDTTWTETGSQWPTLNPSAPPGNTALFKGTTYAFPYYPVVGVPRPPMRAAIMCYSTDAPSSTPFSLPLYGTTHTFRSTGTVAAGYGRGSSSFATAGLRYE
jgi:hypothetical protein